MGARTRLNSFYVTSSLITAAFFGAITESWFVFGLITLISLGMMWSDSRIRLGGSPRQNRGRYHRRR